MEDYIDWNEGKRNYLGGRGKIFDNTKRQEPKIDVEVSKIVGKDVRVNDPRLIRWAAEQSRKRGEYDNDPRPLLSFESNREELKRIFN